MGLVCFTVSNLNVLFSITYDFGVEVASKSVILMDLKSFRIILLRGASNQGDSRFRQGDFSHFGNGIRMGRRSLQSRLPQST